eukprot:jgi/Tetstr1/448694/TSEL_035934.t1
MDSAKNVLPHWVRIPKIAKPDMLLKYHLTCVKARPLRHVTRAMATNADDLNNAEAAHVEAEVRAQVLQDDRAFQGVHAGAKERLHDNTSPSDAKGTNLVAIDVSDVELMLCQQLPVKLTCGIYNPS